MQTLTFSTGYTVTVRRQLPSDAVARFTAVARQELADDEPQPPTQQVQTAPDQWETVANPADPDYQQAQQAWGQRVAERSGAKLMQAARDYALALEVDPEAVAEYRALMRDLGVDAPDDDRDVWLWHIVAPNVADQTQIFEAMLGRTPTEAAVAAHKDSFRG